MAEIDIAPGPFTENPKQPLVCSACGVLLRQGQIVVNHPVYRADGELSYIEILHIECVGPRG